MLGEEGPQASDQQATTRTPRLTTFKPVHGRSPGFAGHRLCLSSRCIRASDVQDKMARRLQLRGQPRIWRLAASPSSLLAPDIGIWGTVNTLFSITVAVLVKGEDQKLEESQTGERPNSQSVVRFSGRLLYRENRDHVGRVGRERDFLPASKKELVPYFGKRPSLSTANRSLDLIPESLRRSVAPVGLWKWRRIFVRVRR
jgi:hypothetical protein